MLLQLLVHLVALFDDGHEQRIIIKFVDNAITACAGAVAGIANNFSGIAWCGIVTQFLDLRASSLAISGALLMCLSRDFTDCLVNRNLRIFHAH